MLEYTAAVRLCTIVSWLCEGFPRRQQATVKKGAFKWKGAPASWDIETEKGVKFDDIGESQREVIVKDITGQDTLWKNN